jgi:hypothetical protein
VRLFSLNWLQVGKDINVSARLQAGARYGSQPPTPVTLGR